MQLILEANNIPVSTAHFGAFLRFWKNFNLCQNYVNTQESKGKSAAKQATDDEALLGIL